MWSADSPLGAEPLRLADSLASCCGRREPPSTIPRWAPFARHPLAKLLPSGSDRPNPYNFVAGGDVPDPIPCVQPPPVRTIPWWRRSPLRRPSDLPPMPPEEIRNRAVSSGALAAITVLAAGALAYRLTPRVLDQRRTRTWEAGCTRGCPVARPVPDAQTALLWWHGA
ncbi:hypothetical protein SSP24_70060 [Streptomyces spinoverrucosus]|uniref:Uncharacterized protein n=1 Tax=Streptomyces spinoverrucosus TaxID=284043 RepID=A0A4Y3VUC3_9ACTN|nr:hypothetical protein SSP24_70060 [Streptomyces spinoverrucosus]GHB83806.1 hypothetical protein GCM10010397_63780 [Streptomyces spinoverrucosus]